MTCIQEELESLLVAQNSRPRERSVPARARVWVSHVHAIYEALNKGEVVLCNVYS